MTSSILHPLVATQVVDQTFRQVKLFSVANETFGVLTGVIPNQVGENSYVAAENITAQFALVCTV